jgi:hypothetical protein
LQRYDERSQAVVNEANAIGTAYLRAQLLAGGMSDEVQALLRRYLDIRIEEGRVNLEDTSKRKALLLETNRMTEELWIYARKVADQDARSVAVLFIESLNELINAFGKRDAGLNRHVPETVFFLLFATIVMTTATLGYASGITGHRASFATLGLVALIALVVFLIIDLDRPRRGLIQVSQESLLNLQQTIGSPQGRTRSIR